MRLFIHTAGRPVKMATWHALTPSLQERTVVVVQEREAHLYPQYPRLWVLPRHITRLSPTRQFIIETAKQAFKEKYICMMDDDFLSFGFRTDHRSIKLSVATSKEINWMFNKCETWLRNGLAHCGISPRGRNHTVEINVAHNVRMCQMLCYDLNVLSLHGFRFDRIPCMQDFDMTLQLLRAGYANKVLYKGCTNSRGSGGAGGCNSYRTPKMQSDTAKKLAKLHPEFVRLREKTSGQYKDQTIYDVTVQWKKAYAHSQR